MEDVTQFVVIAGLTGAIVWDLLTWWWGLPTSSSHALIGGYAGAAITVASYWLLQRKNPRSVDNWFRRLQLVSAAAYSIGHGGNDAQKTMGIMAGALFTAGYVTRYDMAHDWGRFKWPVILAAHAAIALGTYFGGWRIVHTMAPRSPSSNPSGDSALKLPAL